MVARTCAGPTWNLLETETRVDGVNMQGLLFLIGVYYTFRGIKRAVRNLSAGRAPWRDATVLPSGQVLQRRRLLGSRPEEV